MGRASDPSTWSPRERAAVKKQLKSGKRTTSTEALKKELKKERKPTVPQKVKEVKFEVGAGIKPTTEKRDVFGRKEKLLERIAREKKESVERKEGMSIRPRTTTERIESELQRVPVFEKGRITRDVSATISRIKGSLINLGIIKAPEIEKGIALTEQQRIAIGKEIGMPIDRIIVTDIEQVEGGERFTYKERPIEEEPVKITRTTAKVSDIEEPRFTFERLSKAPAHFGRAVELFTTGAASAMTFLISKHVAFDPEATRPYIGKPSDKAVTLEQRFAKSFEEAGAAGKVIFIAGTAAGFSTATQPFVKTITPTTVSVRRTVITKEGVFRGEIITEAGLTKTGAPRYIKTKVFGRAVKTDIPVTKTIKGAFFKKLKVDMLPEEYASYLSRTGKIVYKPYANILSKSAGEFYPHHQKPKIRIASDLTKTPAFRQKVISHELIHYKTRKIFSESMINLEEKLPYKLRPSEIVAYTFESPTRKFKVVFPKGKITATATGMIKDVYVTRGVGLTETATKYQLGFKFGKITEAGVKPIKTFKIGKQTLATITKTKVPTAKAFKFGGLSKDIIQYGDETVTLFKGGYQPIYKLAVKKGKLVPSKIIRKPLSTEAISISRQIDDITRVDITKAYAKDPYRFFGKDVPLSQDVSVGFTKQIDQFTRVFREGDIYVPKPSPAMGGITRVWAGRTGLDKSITAQLQSIATAIKADLPSTTRYAGIPAIAPLTKADELTKQTFIPKDPIGDLRESVQTRVISQVTRLKRERQVIKERTGMMDIEKVKQDIFTIPAAKSAVAQKEDIRVIQKQKIDIIEQVMEKEKLLRGVATTTPIIPSLTFLDASYKFAPFFFALPNLRFPSDIPRKAIKTKRAFKYTPSLIATELGIFGEEPMGELTIQIRPVSKGYKEFLKGFVGSKLI